MTVEIIDCVQGSPEWFQARLGIPTASCFSQVLAKGEGKVRATYMRRLAGEIITGQSAETFKSEAMERGNQMEAEAALALVKEWVASNGLTLHPEKTRIANCRKKGKGFEFLGYRFERGRRHVRKKSIDKLKETIRFKTRRTRGQSLKVVVVDLNRTLKGWFGYFKHAHPRIFLDLDQMIRRRLRAMLRKQARRPGVGNDRSDHRQWPNAHFAKAGLFALHTAWHTARQSR